MKSFIWYFLLIGLCMYVQTFYSQAASIVVMNYSFLRTNTLQSDLENAKKAGKNVFLIVSNAGISSSKLQSVAQEAVKLNKKSIILKMNRDDKENASLVTKFRLAGAPLPLILVIASNGLPVGALTESEANAQDLVKMIPSPKMLEAISALNSGKAVFFVCSKKTFTDKSKALDNCRIANTQMAGKAIIVEVDLDDKNEADLIKNLNIPLNTATTITVVSNNQGQVTAIFNTTPEVYKLVSSVSKVAKSCCPSGSSKKCN